MLQKEMKGNIAYVVGLYIQSCKKCIGQIMTNSMDCIKGNNIYVRVIKKKHELVCSIDQHSSCKGMMPNDMCEDCETGCCTEEELKESAKKQIKGEMIYE